MSDRPTRVMASVAQWERRAIGQRTREALAVKRAQGVRLGRPPVLDNDLRVRLRRQRARGWTYQRIAERLNAERVPTAHGGLVWYPSTVRKVVVTRGREDRRSTRRTRARTPTSAPPQLTLPLVAERRKELDFVSRPVTGGSTAQKGTRRTRGGDIARQSAYRHRPPTAEQARVASSRHQADQLLCGTVAIAGISSRNRSCSTERPKRETYSCSALWQAPAH